MKTQFTVTIEFQTDLFLSRRDYVVETLAEIEIIRARAVPYKYKVIGHNCEQVMTVGEIFADIANERREQAKVAQGRG